VPARRSPTERGRARIDELFAGGQPLAETLEEAARLRVRLVIQAALEAEVSEFLGWDRYQRDPDAGPGYRNGHQPVQVKTTAGPVVLERPKLRYQPAVCVPAAGQGRQPHQRTGGLGAGQLRPWPVGARCGGGAGRGARARGGPQQVDGVPDLPGHQGGVRPLHRPRPRRRGGGLSVPGRRPLPLSPWSARRAGPGRLGREDHRRPGAAWAWTRQPRGHRSMGWVPGGPGRPRAGCAAAGHHRWRARAV
jgi:hypothetical protein